MMTIFNPLSVIMGLAIGSRPQTSLPINRLRYISIMTLFCRTNALKKNRGVKNCKVFELNVALCYKSTCV
ncbi:hypothetical protein CWM83_26065 [Klebsiella pneumoniae]|nr:hypothetical protein CWM83_26065 [Klebsiella pneumoniae]